MATGRISKLHPIEQEIVEVILRDARNLSCAGCRKLAEMYLKR